MSLRWFHALLILLSAVLAVIVGVWCVNMYSAQGGAIYVLGAVAAFCVSLALVLYDRWFLRKTRTLR